MTATRTSDGKWAVMTGGEMLAGPFETSSEAWRWIDRYEGEPVSRGEQTAEWIFRKILDAGT